MSMEWTHNEQGDCPNTECGHDECSAFPTLEDRISMVEALADKYDEACDEAELNFGTKDFVRDVLILAMRRGLQPQPIFEAALDEYTKQIDADWKAQEDADMPEGEV